MVFSTLHTNDAPSAAIRMMDMGIEPYLLASSLRAALAQRLVRRLCEKCRKTTSAEEQGVKLNPAIEKLINGKPLAGGRMLNAWEDFTNRRNIRADTRNPGDTGVP